MLLTGLGGGIAVALLFIMLIERLDLGIRRFLFTHSVATDVVITGAALILFPIAGPTALIIAATVGITISSYMIFRKPSVLGRHNKVSSESVPSTEQLATQVTVGTLKTVWAVFRGILGGVGSIIKTVATPSQKEN